MSDDEEFTVDMLDIYIIAMHDLLCKISNDNLSMFEIKRRAKEILSMLE